MSDFVGVSRRSKKPFQVVSIGAEREVSSFKVRAKHKYGQYYREAFVFCGFIVALGVVQGSAEVSGSSN